MRHLGSVHDRTDTSGAYVPRVAVISGDHYSQVTGMVWVCPVHPTDVHTPDHPLFIRSNIAGIASYLLPDEAYRMPSLGLGEAPVDHLDDTTVDMIQNILRSIFSR